MSHADVCIGRRGGQVTSHPEGKARGKASRAVSEAACAGCGLACRSAHLCSASAADSCAAAPPARPATWAAPCRLKSAPPTPPGSGSSPAPLRKDSKQAAAPAACPSPRPGGGRALWPRPGSARALAAQRHLHAQRQLQRRHPRGPRADGAGRALPLPLTWRLVPALHWCCRLDWRWVASGSGSVWGCANLPARCAFAAPSFDDLHFSWQR